MDAVSFYRDFHPQSHHWPAPADGDRHPLPGLPRTVLRLHRTALTVRAGFVAALVLWPVWLFDQTTERNRDSL